MHSFPPAGEALLRIAHADGLADAGRQQLEGLAFGGSGQSLERFVPGVPGQAEATHVCRPERPGAQDPGGAQGFLRIQVDQRPAARARIFYKDFGYSTGLVELGRFDAGIAGLQRSGPLQVTIRRAAE